jgi:hypothetical protein
VQEALENFDLIGMNRAIDGGDPCFSHATLDFTLKG